MYEYEKCECGAVACRAEVRHSLFCKKHWDMLNDALRKALCRTQSDEAFEAAQRHIAVKEGHWERAA
jgi:hypothetical protein